ncbi:hypothetical protein M405DRAFT_803180 [Rhizopogon salebrosus TDB-379]|nr:hypothetical protein M405DRAFT_803180 [Rhizopogon salebrosus TDB-379]
MSSTANRINESLANISHRLSPMSHVPTISTMFVLPCLPGPTHPIQLVPLNSRTSTFVPWVARRH